MAIPVVMLVADDRVVNAATLVEISKVRELEFVIFVKILVVCGISSEASLN